MKKFTATLIIVCLLFSVGLLAVACDDNVLKTPEISISGNVVSWGSIKNAEKYNVNITGDNGFEEQNISVTSTSTTIDTLATGTTSVDVKVKAIGDGKTYTDSKYSKSVKYTPGVRLDTPILILGDMTSDGLGLSWKSIPNATNYVVKLDCKQDNSKNKSYNVDTNSLVVPKADLTKVSKYVFTVQSLSTDTSFTSSAVGGSVEYIVSAVLSAPKNVYYNKSGIYWDSVENAKQYKIYYSTIEDGDYQLLTKVTGTRYSKESLIENADLGNNQYYFKVSATNDINAVLYKESPQAQVTKGKDSTEAASLIKLKSPSNMTLDKGILKFTGVVGAKAGYSIDLNSGASSNQITLDIAYVEGEEQNYEIDIAAILKAKFDKGTGYFGKVYNLQMYAKSDDEGALLESLKADVRVSADDAKSSLAEYCYTGYFEEYKTSESLWSTHTKPDDSNKYKIVDSVAKFVYMLNNDDYYFVNPFDGLGSNIYGGNSSVSKSIIGNNDIVKNFNVIMNADSSKYSLFGNVSATGVIQGLSFVNVKFLSNRETIKNEETDNDEYFFQSRYNANSALLTMENKGTIDSIYYNCDVMVVGNHGGLVYENSGTISNCTVTGKISGELNVAGLVYDNKVGAKVNNCILYDMTITSSNVLVESSKSSSYLVGGLAVINSGLIKSSMVLNSSVTIEKTTSQKDSSIEICVGGMVANNNSGTIEDSYVESMSTAIKKSLVKAYANGYTSAKRIAGGLIGKATDNSTLNNVYLRRVSIVSTDGMASGIIGLANGRVAINNSFLESCTIEGGNKNVVANSGENVVYNITKSYNTTVSNVANTVEGFTVCTASVLKDNLLALKDADDKNLYSYNADLGIVLANAISIDKTTLTLNKSSHDRETFAKVFKGNEKIAATSKALINTTGTFIDKYMVNGSLVFITVVVK